LLFCSGEEWKYAKRLKNERRGEEWNVMHPDGPTILVHRLGPSEKKKKTPTTEQNSEDEMPPEPALIRDISNRKPVQAHE
jgi:hypothetical protein